jgi:predicted nuclease with TOPRIM domain
MTEPIKLPPLPALVSAMITDYATLAVKQNTAELLKELTTLQRWYADVSMRAEKAEAEVERLREELDRLKEAIPAVLTHIDDIGARGYYSGKTPEEDAAIEVLRAVLRETK